MVGDNGKYAITSKFHGMNFGGLDLAFYANYGFKSEKLESDNNVADSAYQLAAEANFSGQKFVVRYSDNAIDSVYDLK
ncbi:carbohydrate porin, partial [Vibrio sp. 10N.222.49.C9]